MSGLRGSMTPSGKQSRSAYDYPLSQQQQQQQQQQHAGQPALSSPIHIQPRSSPRAASSINAHVTHVAQSCPTFSWQPPPAPAARPRLPSVDPPPMELPPSPPVFSPMQAEALKGRKEESTGIALKKQIYSRSLSNYSSSAPTHVDYLSKFHPNFGPLDETSGMDGDSDEEEEEEHAGGYRPSARAMQSATRADEDEDETAPSTGGRPIGIGIGIGAGKGPNAHRIRQMQRGDDFSLSKSPTIFSILSTSHQNAPPGLHTADTSTSSSGSGSPGHSILGSIAAGVGVGGDSKRRSLTSHKPPTAHSPDAAAADTTAEDDLQFSISLTDEQEGEGEGEEHGNQQDSLPIY